MKADEWANLATTMAGVWPAGKLDAEQVETWYGLLADLEGAHVTSALQELAKVSQFMPSVAEIRAETARREVASRPVPIPVESTSPMLSLREWRAAGHPGCEEYGLTPSDCERITHGGDAAAMLRDMP